MCIGSQRSDRHAARKVARQTVCDGTSLHMEEPRSISKCNTRQVPGLATSNGQGVEVIAHIQRTDYRRTFYGHAGSRRTESRAHSSLPVSRPVQASLDWDIPHSGYWECGEEYRRTPELVRRSEAY